MKVFIPISFPDIDELVIGTDLKADKIRVFLHNLLLSKLSQGGYIDELKNNPYNYIFQDGYVSLHSSILRSLLTPRYIKYIIFLEKKGLVTWRETSSSKKAYTPGHTSIHYKISPKLLYSKTSKRHFKMESIKDPCTIKAINRTKKKYENEHAIVSRSLVMEDIHISLMNIEKTVRFDIDKACVWMENSIKSYENDTSRRNGRLDNLSYKFSITLGQLELINADHFTGKVDVFGERLHTPLKRIQSEMREFMYFDSFPDEELSCLDISNSQLYFSTLLINKRVVNEVIPEFSIFLKFADEFKNKLDFTNYISSCEDGTIYNLWKEIGNYKTRDEAKKDLIAILFSKTNSRIPAIKYFEQAYPSVWKFFNKIKSIKEDDLPFITEIYAKNGKYKPNRYHCNLSCAVQRLESRIFIKRICQALFDNGISRFFTIHDSVYFPKLQNEVIQNIIENEFTKLGIAVPKFKLSEL